MVITFKRYHIYAKRICDKVYTEWASTEDAEEIARFVDRIHELGYLAAVKDTVTGEKWSGTKWKEKTA